jgi:hypothetical protein
LEMDLEIDLEMENYGMEIVENLGA